MALRIIAGEFGGRRIASAERPGLRPTTDRVRGSIFSILGARIDFDEIDALDLFAGTGALGIEALSRGARRCTFVEKDRRTAALIESNLDELGALERGSVVVRDAIAFVGETADRYDLILADPPYAATIFDRLVHDLFERSLLREGGLFLLEHASTMQPRAAGGAAIVLTRTFGDTAITLYCAPSLS